MHYTEPVMRPPHEAYSILIEATAGCSHNSCTFCSSYKDICYHAAPLEQIKEDIMEAGRNLAYYRKPLQVDPATQYIYEKTGACANERVFLLSGDAFSLGFEYLKQIALWIHEYIPTVKCITLFSTIKDISRKSDEELIELKNLGYTFIYIGVECGDETILKEIKKDHGVEEIVIQCNRLDKAGIMYETQYLTGLGGSGRGTETAQNSIPVYNKINSIIIGSSSLAILPGTELENDYKSGKFIEASEVERLEETKIFLKGLERNVYFTSAHVTNMVTLNGLVIYERENMINTLDMVIEALKHDEHGKLSKFRRYGV